MSETIITNVSSATTTNCGVVKVGNGLSVTADGTLSAKTHGNETWISTLITLSGEGSWTVTSNNTYAEIASWFDKYDRVFASLIKGSDNILKFGESSVELLKESDGRIRSMPINIEYATQLSANTDELIVMMEEEGSITIVTASKSDTPDTATIIWDGNSSNLNWKNVDDLYKAGRRLQVLSTEWGEDKFILPLVSVVNDGNNRYVFSAHYIDGRYAEVWIWHDPSIPNENHKNEIGSSITSAKLADGAVTTNKIADGAVTASKLASGIEGWNGEITTVTKASGSSNKIGILGSIRFITGDFYCYIINYYASSATTPSKVSWSMKDASNNDILTKPTGTNNLFQSIVPVLNSSSSYWDYRTIMGFVVRSTSAQAALATLLPVQDECEEMEAEVTKLEQDWIDNPDETVAVDGNGVPVTIATKKTELEKKQAELEKLREDYFSKLGDWKNEVQE